MNYTPRRTHTPNKHEHLSSNRVHVLSLLSKKNEFIEWLQLNVTPHLFIMLWADWNKTNFSFALRMYSSILAMVKNIYINTAYCVCARSSNLFVFGVNFQILIEKSKKNVNINYILCVWYVCEIVWIFLFLSCFVLLQSQNAYTLRVCVCICISVPVLVSENVIYI